MTWDEFARVVKHRARYTVFSRASNHATELADRVVRSILDSARAEGLFRTLPPGETYWRGRTRDTKPPPDYGAIDLGPVPPEKAASNRMSPAGITMFYGSSDPETALSEIVVHKPRKFVVLAAFELVRGIVVLDLTDLDWMRRPDTSSHQLLEAFVADLGRPIRLDGREHLEYIPTQIVTEYIRRGEGTGVSGILFRSVYHGGVNCVLFVGPDACAQPGQEGESTILRYRPESRRVIVDPLTRG